MRDTSKEAYNSIHNLSEKQQTVYRVLKDHYMLCNQEIAQILHWEINRVTGRTNDLVKMGLVTIGKKAVFKETGKRVIFWCLKEKYDIINWEAMRQELIEKRKINTYQNTLF